MLASSMVFTIQSVTAEELKGGDLLGANSRSQSQNSEQFDQDISVYSIGDGIHQVKLSSDGQPITMDFIF